MLGRPGDFPAITRDQVARARPDPHLFRAATAPLGFALQGCLFNGDRARDLLAARRSASLLSSGYGHDQLQASGASRVYADAADLFDRLEEVGCDQAGDDARSVTRAG